METARDADVMAPTNKTESSQVQKLNNVFKSDFDAKYNIVDIQTPRNVFMSGKYKRSYAYYTLRNRLPVVLTNVIDTITKDKAELVTQFGECAREELKIIIGLISRLKYELQTDKPFQRFNGNEPDRDIWNNFIAHLPEDERSFYRACWMHAECYMYRKLYSFVENSIFLTQFDYFGKFKQNLLTNCMDNILSLSKYTRRSENSLEMFSELLKINLWSSLHDTVMTSNLEDMRDINKKILNDVSATNNFIIINDAAKIWKCLEAKQKYQHIDIVLDKVGYELFTDFILAEYMIEKGLASKVRFHVKAHPWFVSDITEPDFHWTLNYLCEHPDYIISLMGKKIQQFLDEGKFELAPISYFWTSPYPLHYMANIAPELYETLKQSKLIIFKGDLNYRKLLSDVSWETTQDIKTCLRGFLPCNLCSIRVVKAEIICGLPERVSENLFESDPHWMIKGTYGSLQFVDNSCEFGY